MSIIHEALKKTGQSVIAENEKTGAGRTEHKPGSLPPIEVHRAKRSKNHPFVALIVIALIATPLLLPNLRHNNDTAPRTVAMGPEASSTASAQFGIEEAPLPVPSIFAAKPLSKPSVSGLQLSGIVYSAKESYCLINGKVYKVGEQVNGATIENIQPDSVVLDRAGNKITLRAAV